MSKGGISSSKFDSSNAVDYPTTAVAVDAFVVKSIENRDQNRTSTGANNKPFSMTKTKADDTIGRPEKYTDKNIDITSPKNLTRQSTSQKEITTKGPITMTPGVGKSKADIWEKDQMKKIKERYEKLNKVIIDWETKKKKKAKRHLEHIEARLDRRRAKTRQSFYSDIGRIENIAGGAQAKAEQTQEKEELKVKERANKIRSTGKMPATCLCF